MRRLLPLLAIAALGCGDPPPVGGEFDVRCFALEVCEEEVASAVADLDGLLDELGLRDDRPAFSATVSGSGHGVVVLDDQGTTRPFFLPNLPTGYFEEGEPVEFLRSGAWQVVRGERRAAAVLVVEVDGPHIGMEELPDGGPTVHFVDTCKVGGSTAVALQATHGGTTRILPPGKAGNFDEWRIVHLGGRWDRVQTGDDGSGGGGGRPDPGAGGAMGCSQRQGLVVPTRVQVAAVATWQSRTIPWCEPEALEGVEGFAWGPAFEAGLRREDGYRFEGTATGWVTGVTSDRILVDLHAEGSVIYQWPGALPAAPEVGEQVELVGGWPWAELRGSVRLALLQERDFVASGPFRAFDEVDLDWVAGCAFRDPEPGSTCGGPNGDAHVIHLRVDDARTIAPGESTVVDGIEIALLGAVQYPSHSNDECVVEAMFAGVITAVDAGIR